MTRRELIRAARDRKLTVCASDPRRDGYTPMLLVMHKDASVRVDRWDIYIGGDWDQVAAAAGIAA